MHSILFSLEYNNIIVLENFVKISRVLCEKFDVKIFQDLSLFIRKDVLKGKVVYAKNFAFVCDVAYQTIKEFDMFKKYYYDYIRYEVMQ